MTACNFYTKEHELGALYSEDDGIYLYSGSTAVFYSKNSASLFSEIDPNDIVVVGASMNYRYAPVNVTDEGKACFLAGTLVKMSDGSSKPIEMVAVGDKVWTGDKKSDTVKGIIKKHDPFWLSVVIGGKVVRTVPDQKFFVIAVEKDGNLSKDEILYTALMLKVGDVVKDDTGKPVEVRAKSKIYEEKVPTWDLVLRSGVFYYADGFKVHSVVE